MTRSEMATEFFLSGYNCAQSVAMAFADLIGLDEKFVAKAVSPFGGGMGRMREVCGAVSGMYFVLGILYGYDSAADKEGKKRLYEEVQLLADKFRRKNGSIICREILKNPSSETTLSERTKEYYDMRPCARMVKSAAELLDEFIKEH